MTELENILKKHQSEFAPVIPFNREKDKFLRLDFSAANPVITPELFNDTSSFSAYINGRLAAANARYGIGGYAEN
ncbi:MAG TPA: peptidase M23, partial [Chitinophagaceae bacterium]|nr:peptidase M23 [Chitinophagaceae bacterium]